MRWQPRSHPTRLYRRMKIKGRSGWQKDPLARPTSQAMLDFWEWIAFFFRLSHTHRPLLFPIAPLSLHPIRMGQAQMGGWRVVKTIQIVQILMLKTGRSSFPTWK